VFVVSNVSGKSCQYSTHTVIFLWQCSSLFVLFLLLDCETCFLLVVSVDEVIQSSDSEMEDLLEEPASKKTRRAAREEKRSKAWLKEDEDIVDFLDPAAARKVVGKTTHLVFH